MSPDRPDSPVPNPPTLHQLRTFLLRWYRSQHRKLPWRAQPGELGNPYHVLVSEVMLQQTQVATVLDYFRRFIARWPGVADLAAADERDVLRAWQGLGYYRRARHLHAAAKAIVAADGGKVPDTVEALLALPGVGRYTAGAIASIAFGRRAPILDGNVARVLSRWFALADPLDARTRRTRLWPLAEAVVPPRHPGDFNQAMMELGSLVCTPRQPRCSTCPVAASCLAHQRGQQEALPVMPARKAPRAVTHHLLAVRKGDKYLFVQRPATGLWSNMWGLPTAEHLRSRTPQPNGPALRAWAAQHLHVAITSPRAIAEFAHQTSHRAIRFVLWTATAPPGGARRSRASGLWRNLDDLDDLPLANPQRRAIECLRIASAAPRPVESPPR